MKLMLCHPGHTFSTADVYDGLAVGFAALGVEVVPFRWDKALQIVGAIAGTALASGGADPEEAARMRHFGGWLAAADTMTVAVEQEVDAALIINGLLFPAQRAYTLRKLGIPVACYGTEAPYFHEAERAICGAYSHWFTQERKSVDFFRHHTERPNYLPMAYNPMTHQPGKPDPDKVCDVVFVGGGYPERRSLLDSVDWTGIRHERRGTLWQIDWDNPPPSEPGGAVYSEGAIQNTETTAWHQSAAISLNLHRRMTMVETREQIADGLAESLGPRAYEIPAVGGFQLIDDERAEVHDVFGASATTFKAWNPNDLERQMRYWLTHPDERERRQRAQYEAVRPHTWIARAQTILDAL